MATQFTDDQVRDYVANIINQGDASGLSDFEINQNIYAALQEFEVAPTQLDSAMGWESGVSQNWIDTTSGGTVAPAAPAPAPSTLPSSVGQIADYMKQGMTAEQAQMQMVADMRASGMTDEQILQQNKGAGPAIEALNAQQFQEMQRAETEFATNRLSELGIDLDTALRMNPDLAQAGIDTPTEFVQWYNKYGQNEPNRNYTGFTDQDIVDSYENLRNQGQTHEQALAWLNETGATYGSDLSRIEPLVGGLANKGYGTDPLTGLPNLGTGDTGTGATGGTGGTGTDIGTGGTDTGGGSIGGGIIGSTPSGMLTPFQQASLAQSQALLGTMQAAAGPRGSLATTNYAPYVNPYTSGVINATMADLERQRQMQQNQIGYQATQAGAFGGSRHGVAEALTNEAMQRTMAQTAAQQRQAGFQQAQQAAQFDIGSELAQRAQGLSAAQQMSNLGQTSFGYGLNVQDMLSQAGAQQQAMQQAQIDAAQGQFGAYTAYPTSGAGMFSQILGSAPSGQTQSSSPGLMGYLTTAATVAPTAAKYLPMVFGGSDIRLKKNIKKVGELANGLGVYTWEWKDKVKDLVGNFSMTKGVMAQEAMKVIPEAVITGADGYLRVDYSHPEISGVA